MCVLNPSKLLDKKNMKKLAYTVNPLPYSLLNFILYFGSLEENDEKRYIENMVEKSLEKINYKANSQSSKLCQKKKRSVFSKFKRCKSIHSFF